MMNDDAASDNAGDTDADADGSRVLTGLGLAWPHQKINFSNWGHQTLSKGSALQGIW